MTEEHKKKIALANTGKKHSEEDKKKISEANKGHKPWNKDKKGVMPDPWNKGKTGINSEETRRKQSIAQKKRFEKEDIWNKGKKPSPKTLKKMSKTWFTKGQEPWMKGKKQSDSSKQKMSVAKKKLFASGLLQPPLKGKHHSEETKRKHSEFMKKLVANGWTSPMKGKKHTPASLKIMREKRLHFVFPKKDTSIEKKLQKLLNVIGIKFEKHKPILGQPDVFIQPNICIFTDGDFWHANPKPWIKHGFKVKGFKPNDHVIGKRVAKDIWDKDKRVTNTLKKDGYVVLRFWETEIENNLEKCLQKILKAIK